ncbi:HEAT repeat domain-containing protein [Nocardiopsis sp. NPDC057823]|uniref:HEAT repeat domain-containing protein n=1 Tax=Nocardiopsis sp. NPDC057823 TaxID=3346256 RepID=UPI00366BD9D4
MARFVHLAPAAAARRAARSGLRANPGRDGGRGVYCFPVLPSYTLTHQWLRELSRWKDARGMAAVHLLLPDGEPVLVGHYGGPGRRTTAAGAVGAVAALEDPRGWEVFVPRAVTAREVRAVRTVRRGVGWRYLPGAHGRPPCTCAGCRVRGAYGSRRLLERRPHPADGPWPPPRVLLERIDRASADGDAAALCAALEGFGHRRRGPVNRLLPLAGHPDPRVRSALVWAVCGWSTPGTGDLISLLAADPDPGVREAAGDVREIRGDR